MYWVREIFVPMQRGLFVQRDLAQLSWAHYMRALAKCPIVDALFEVEVAADASKRKREDLGLFRN